MTLLETEKKSNKMANAKQNRNPNVTVHFTKNAKNNADECNKAKLPVFSKVHSQICFNLMVYDIFR